MTASPGIRPAARVATLAPNFFGAMDRRIAAARAAGVDVIDLSKGNPDLPTPPHIVEAMQCAVADPATHRYPSFTPQPEVKAAIAHRYREDHGVELDPDTQVAIFHGSHEGLMASILGFADPGDAIVLPDPGYPAYAAAAHLAGARVVGLPLDHDLGYQPRFDALDDVERARVLLLNYPHNPTGAIATPDTFARARSVAGRLGAVFVHDFAYSSLGFAHGRPLSALTQGTDGTVEVSTLSKTYSMAGWRFGYAAGDAAVIDVMKRYQAQAFSTIFAATQRAAAVALVGDQAAAQEFVDVYRSRRDLVVAGLRGHGWHVFQPDGGFFVWARHDGSGDDVAFAERLLQEQGVAVAPGSGFGTRGAGWVRLGLVHPADRLREAVARLGSPSHTSPDRAHPERPHHPNERIPHGRRGELHP